MMYNSNSKRLLYKAYLFVPIYRNSKRKITLCNDQNVSSQIKFRALTHYLTRMKK